MKLPTCKSCAYQSPREGEPDPVFCPKCDGDDWAELNERVNEPAREGVKK